MSKQALADNAKKALPLLVFFEKDEQANQEYLSLIGSTGYLVNEPVYSRTVTVNPKTFVGKGMAERLALIVRQQKIDVLLININISASQQRNLQKSLCCDVLDWTGLILDIFSKRARSFEGRMQVELAQLKYLSSRLIRGWTHLERQKGGLGLRGPGETQLEVDRRLVTARIKQVNEKLKKIKKQRARSGNARRRVGVPTAALVGYTNAGKSTLFNALTDNSAYAADQLFATLDTTTRLLKSDSSENIVVSDTVGFIRNLPPTLIAAFGATLEETSEAQLLLHVVDASDLSRVEQVEEVEKVLDRIGAAKIPTIMVYNKIDSCADSESRIERDQKGEITSVRISARDGDGLKMLVSAVNEKIGGKKVFLSVRLRPSEARLRSRFYEWKAVSGEKIMENGDCLMQLSLSVRELNMLNRLGRIGRLKIPSDTLGQKGDGQRLANGGVRAG